MSRHTKFLVLIVAIHAFVGASMMPWAQASQPVPGEEATGGSIVTPHTGRFDEKKLSYRAVASWTDVPGPEGEPWASIFSVAYVRVGENSHRPVMFIFNGGPGAASAFLHIGALGPKRVEFPADLASDLPGAPPLSNNDESPLGVTDLVFIDPPETGYSVSLPADRKRQFASVEGDARLIGEFIRVWLRANHREEDPKFLFGESYGATRASLMANRLAEASAGGPAPILFTGVILISPLLTVDDFGLRPMNAQAHAVELPSMAAIAWYHDKVGRTGRTLVSFTDEARRFAFEEYLPALMYGDEIGTARKNALARKLSDLTGISAQIFLDHKLKITPTEFRADLIPGKLLGAYDGRYSSSGQRTLSEPGSAIADPSFDPSLQVQTRVIAQALPAYFREDLNIEGRGTYQLHNSKLGGSWDFGSKFRAPATEWLTQALAKNPNINLFMASGYDDLMAPFTATRYLMSQLELKPGHGQMRTYEGGHLFYTDPQSHKIFCSDLSQFILSSLRSK